MKKSLLIALLCIFSNLAFSQTVPKNTRLIEPTSTHGDFVKSFIRHLNSAKDEMYFTTLVNSGESEYFGNQYNSGTRLISRLSNDGLPLWTCRFIGDANINSISLNDTWATVDINDNIFLLISVKKATVFIDSAGNSTSIPFNNLSSEQNVILKISKTGTLLWYQI